MEISIIKLNLEKTYKRHWFAANYYLQNENTTRYCYHQTVLSNLKEQYIRDFGYTEYTNFIESNKHSIWQKVTLQYLTNRSAFY